MKQASLPRARGIDGDDLAAWMVNQTTLVDECWVWQRFVNGKGYGKLNYKRQQLAYRIAYLLLRGPIPDGLQLDHLCRNRTCINPWHLEIVTCRENLLRGNTFQATNAAKTHCLRGHPFEGENVYVTSRGHRGCRTCAAARQRARYAAAKNVEQS